MTSAINPPAYKLRGLPVSVWFRFCTPETQKHSFFEKHRNPGSTGKIPGRETGRQKQRNTNLVETPQSGKGREGSGKGNGKAETWEN
jgi:hypothetical protein